VSQVAEATSGDALDVSLHDGVLAEELELTAHLMVAANESDRALSREELDRLLGVGGLLLPAQRRVRQEITDR
jgi:hypothetical protein